MGELKSALEAEASILIAGTFASEPLQPLGIEVTLSPAPQTRRPSLNIVSGPERKVHDLLSCPDLKAEIEKCEDCTDINSTINI